MTPFALTERSFGSPVRVGIEPGEPRDDRRFKGRVVLTVEDTKHGEFVVATLSPLQCRRVAAALLLAAATAEAEPEAMADADVALTATSRIPPKP